MANYPVKLVDAAPLLTLAELPRGDRDLYTVEHISAAWLGIGTADELRRLIDGSTFPEPDQLRFRLEAEAM